MPSSATSRPNLRSARIVDGRSWIADVRYSHLPKEGRNPFAQCNWKAHARHKLAPSSSHSHRRTDCLGAIRDALRVIFQACVCRHLDSAAPCFNNPKSTAERSETDCRRLPARRARRASSIADHQSLPQPRLPFSFSASPFQLLRVSAFQFLPHLPANRAFIG
jgi:hypothetical protein